MSVIEVNNLTKDYGSGRGVFDISFQVEESEVFGFLGPNGAGKSTTIRHLLGFSKPQSGETKIFNKNSFDHYNEILKDVGYIPGEIALPAGLTGWEFIHMMQDLQHKKNEENLNYLLSLFDLQDNVLKGDTKHMSLGVKRKLAIVTAFMNDPKVLILDEPTSGLDPLMQDVFIQYIIKQKKAGKTILLSSHIFSEVDATCDRIAIIKDGKIVSNFIADELRHKNEKVYKVGFDHEEDFLRFRTQAESSEFLKVIKIVPDTHVVYIMTEDKNINQVLSLLRQYPVIYFSQKKETLEDYFMKFYKEDLTYAEVK